VIVDTGGGNIGVAEPFLDLGDVGLIALIIDIWGSTLAAAIYDNVVYL
jgi:hypothetical protein